MRKEGEREERREGKERGGREGRQDHRRERRQGQRTRTRTTGSVKQALPPKNPEIKDVLQLATSAQVISLMPQPLLGELQVRFVPENVMPIIQAAQDT